MIPTTSLLLTVSRRKRSADPIEHRHALIRAKILAESEVANSTRWAYG